MNIENIFDMCAGFDIEKYLQEKGIEYADQGVDVSSGWIGISCPFCPDGDHAFHCGINLETKNYSCWRCSASGWLVNLIKHFESCGFSGAMSVINAVGFGDGAYDPSTISERTYQTSLDLVKTFFRSNKPPKRVEKFLKKRKFNPQKVWDKYGLMYPRVEFDGKYCYRMIIPVFLNKEPVTFVARDVTGMAEAPYKNQDAEEAVIPAKECVYQLDKIKKDDKIIIVEGVFDCWRVRKNCVALLGTKHTRSQIQQLVSKRPKKAYILFDAEPEAQDNAVKIANALSMYMQVEVLELDTGDPDTMSKKDLREVRSLV